MNTFKKISILSLSILVFSLNFSVVLAQGNPWDNIQDNTTRPSNNNYTNPYQQYYNSAGNSGTLFAPGGNSSFDPGAETYAQPDGAPGAIIVPEFQNIPVGIDPNSQAFQSIYGTQGQIGAPIGGAAGAAAGGLGGCAATNLLATNISNSISSFSSSILSPAVIVNEPALRAKETGVSVGPFSGVSLDAVGFCLINSIIEYIGNSTVAWINSGFQGNPVFVDDPGQFFSDIADIEAGAFLGELSGGFLCQPFELDVKLNVANNYNRQISPYSNRGQCSFSGISGNLESFMSGKSFGWQDWVSYTNSSNNPLSATYNAQRELDNRIGSQLSVQNKLLDWGRGFQSFRDPETQKITSPGSVIEQQLNSRLGNSEQRLLVADEFDEIVNALVNQLIKIAINEVTQLNR